MAEEMYDYPGESVTIRLADGKDRALFYSVAAVKRMHRRFGVEAKTINAANREFAEKLNAESLPDALPGLLYEGLKDRSGINGPEDIEDMIFPGAYPYLMDRFNDAYQQAFSPDPNGTRSQPVATAPIAT